VYILTWKNTKIKLKSLLLTILYILNVSKSTIYNIIKRREKGFDYIRRVGSGRPAKIFNKGGLLRLKRLTDHKDGISQNKLAAMFKCDQSYILFIKPKQEKSVQRSTENTKILNGFLTMSRTSLYLMQQSITTIHIILVIVN
jgi:hypothetical protein